MIKFQLAFVPFKHKKSPFMSETCRQGELDYFDLRNTLFEHASKAIFVRSEMKFDHRKFKFTNRMVNKTAIAW